MTTHPQEMSPRAVARAIALLILATTALGIIAQAGISEQLIFFREPGRTATNILAQQTRYGAAFTLYLIELSCQVASVVLTFHLLRVVNARVASLAAVFGVVGCTIKILSRVFYLVPLFVLQQRGLDALGASQLHAVSNILLMVNDRGAGVALAFFGVEAVLEGWLIARSTFLPRWLGILGMVSGAGWLAFYSPTLGYDSINLIALPALVGLVATIGWLLVKGVDQQRWHAMKAGIPAPA